MQKYDTSPIPTQTNYIIMHILGLICLNRQMIVLMTIMIGMTILFEANLNLLGIGIKEPTVAWGSLVNDGYKYLLSHPLLSTALGVAIIMVVFAFNMVGDGIRDVIDPRIRGIF